MFVEVSSVNGECKVVAVSRKSSLHALARYSFALSAEQRRADALAKARRRIVELERKIGQQQVELDFFQEALRHVRGNQQQKDAPGGAASSRSFKK
ncbi:hypothetical protein [Mesorhizobium sp.]|uniref:hypothetical protein n=1 Tax=Mesorhizobium sp. TaxID=1871066 RepID=UPI002580ADDA|nr:hypothetical protein [Mesorhizobium sp.]